MTTRSFSALWAHAASPARVLREIRHRQAVIRSRKALGRLDDHLLRDIGLTRNEAEVEAARTGWDAPLHWRG
jgi:uncharacterized protein YjiS (DUF1127 family)